MEKGQNILQLRYFNKIHKSNITTCLSLQYFPTMKSRLLTEAPSQLPYCKRYHCLQTFKNTEITTHLLQRSKFALFPYSELTLPKILQ